MFGQYKKIDLLFNNTSNTDIDKIIMLSNKPLNTGFLYQELSGLKAHSSSENSIYLRATILKKIDLVDILVVYVSKGISRCFKLTYGIKVSNSFKTKCTIERVGLARYLVCIDVFDNQDPNLNFQCFNLNSILMLSNTMSVNPHLTLPTKLTSDYFIDNNLIYFFIDEQKEPQKIESLRSNKEVFYLKENELDFESKLAEEIKKEIQTTKLDKETFFGYLKQENNIIKSEFNTLQKSLKDSGCGFIEFFCKEFLDFEILWSYVNNNDESRNIRFFSYENDNILLGQHSIISTPVNSVSYKYKKKREMTAPVFSIKVLIDQKSIDHDFNAER